MGDGTSVQGVGASGSRRLFVFNGGFLWSPRVRRILRTAGWQVRLGKPAAGERVGVWGASPVAWRGERVARATGAGVVRVEDAFLRSLFPARVGGEAPVGLLIDETGVHFDPETPSDLERMLAQHRLDDPALLRRARAARSFFVRHDLSKYAATDPGADLPEGPFVLVVDQTRGDASVRASGGDRDTFLGMLAAARAENPGLPVVIKGHPETVAGKREGHFARGDLVPGDRFVAGAVSPGALFARAARVYTLSSGLGFEAILHGHCPEVFGGPFYAGWGLSRDRRAFPRRGRKLDADRLFAAAMILAPVWYCPVRDARVEVEDVLCGLAAEVRAWREDREGWRADGMSRWKRPHIRRFFGGHGRVGFGQGPGRSMVWAGKAACGAPGVRVEDGFLRSRGLGAALTPPVSLAMDDLGIYYDPRRESRLERLIAASVDLSADETARAEALIGRILRGGMTKYSTGGALPELPQGQRVLVVGQVPGDASLRAGAGEVRCDADLLMRARAARPGAVLLYKPHPDVLAGYRRGAVATGADVTLGAVDPHLLLGGVDEVWTMTSLLGFEALLRDVPVTVTGAPFYAGWGLTRDLGWVPERRTARPTVAQLAHAALIGYPRYSDPVTGRAIAPEVAVWRLAEGGSAPRGLLAALQRARARLRRRGGPLGGRIDASDA